MSKFLLIGSVAAVLYGDCAWGMFGRFLNSVESESVQDINSERDNANSKVRSRRKSRTFHQDQQTQTEQVQTSSQQSEENRFIKIENQNYLQYHYILSNNSKIGHATPTTLVSITGDLRGWNDIAEIRYANDVSYDKLENPKVILYRNRDNSCYIILRIEENKHGVFYGINERNIEVGRNSFSVYDLSEDVGSFTDNVSRLIYVDESGLYFVPAEENSVEDVIDTYQKEGKFKFEGSVIKVSAVDGTITLDGEIITKENFFDNWVKEEREIEREVSKEKGRTVIEKVKETKQVLSTKQPGKKKFLRKFYLQERDYNGMYAKNQKDSVNFLIKRCFQLIKAKSKNGAEELVRDGTFASILSAYVPDGYVYPRKVYDAIAAQVSAKGGQTRDHRGRSMSFSNVFSQNQVLFKDPEFVRSLKPAFATIEKEYEHNKESEMWIPFEIVRNL